MVESHGMGRRTYRLVLGQDRDGAAQIIEFEGIGAQSALVIMQQRCPHRAAELQEHGRALARIEQAAGGFWVISRGGERPANRPENSGKPRNTLYSHQGLAPQAAAC